MTNPSTDLRRIIGEFARRPDVTPEQAVNLQATINGSPILIEQMNAAVSAGHLRRIALLSAGDPASGSYNGNTKTMSLPSNSLLTRSAGHPRGEFNIGNMTFVLGHEIQHGFNHALVAQANKDFRAEVRREANSPALEHHYTPAVRAFINANRRNEAAAEIAGWNAVLGHVKTTNQTPTLEDIYKENKGRMADFIDNAGKPPTYTLKPNLILNSNLTLSLTPANLEAMGQNYFDKPPHHTKLGDLGKSDYATYYGAKAIEQIIRCEHEDPGHHRIVFDMAALGLDEKLLEEEGIDLGKIKTPQPYYDSSQTPAVLRHFDHTQDGSFNSQHNHQYVPIASLEVAFQPAHDRSLFSEPNHPDHALYVELKQHLPPETSADRLAQITLAAKLGGVHAGGLQHVVIQDDAVFVIGKTPGDRARVDLSAPPPTAQETLQRSEAFDQQRAQQQMQFVEQQRQINEQAHNGHRMTP